MVGRVPVLGEQDVLEQRRDAMDGGDHGISARHGECSAGAEIILHVDDDEDVLGGDLHLGLQCSCMSFVAYAGQESELN